MDAGILTLISIALNALTAIFAPFLARKLTSQAGKIRKTEDALNLVGAGIRVIERAVEENKDALSRTGAGNRIARTIRTYGPAAKELVDSARAVAGALRAQASAETDVVGAGSANASEEKNI